ncbi:diguanylate cyclase [Bradyrhizobium sp. 151]|uniref:diguanylate cyclase domain-containing protein n=1 Tax=Bradyrhizobium sp. 151 TaxID=2782626 RepID=UPI00320831CD
MLIAVAQVLFSFAERRQMLVARHGGEEFAVVMTGVSRERAAQYAEDRKREFPCTFCF